MWQTGGVHLRSDSLGPVGAPKARQKHQETNMRHIRNLILSGAVLSLAATGVVFAQSSSTGDEPAAATSSSSAVEKNDGIGQRHHRHGRMARMDANGDGAIEQDEMGSRRLERLKKADADGDGTLSQQEIEDMVLQRMVERKARRMAHRLDVDGDGKVTIAETQDRQAKRFALMDRDGDGKLQRDELRRGHRFHKGHGKHHRWDGDHRGGHGPRG
jgi:hypothetical protein